MRVLTVKPRRIILSAKSFATAVETALADVDITTPLQTWKTLLLAALMPLFRTNTEVKRTALRAVRRKDGDDNTTVESSMLDYDSEESGGADDEEYE